MHRIDSGNIPAVLADTEELNITESEAEAAVQRVTGLIKSGSIDIQSLNRAEREVFKDAMDGSTYFCGEGDAIVLKELSRGKSMAMHKAANSLEESFYKETSERIYIPRD